MNLNLPSYTTAAIICLLTLPGNVKAEELRVGVAAMATSTDPHFHRSGYNMSLRENISDALVYANTYNGKLEPRLATNWENLDETTWKLQLNSDARFSNGNSFGVDDIIYSFCRVPNVEGSPGAFTGFIRDVKDIRDGGDGSVIMETSGPNPVLLRSLAKIGIIENPTGQLLKYDKEQCGNDQWLSSEKFNDGTISSGIGPYTVTKFTAGVELILERNSDYYGERPFFSKVTVKSIPENGARIAALLGNNVDLINSVPINGIERIQNEGSFELASTPATRLIFLGMDQESEPTPKVSGTNDKNPFKDIRVRKAFNLAIDRQGIVDKIMGGIASPTSTIVTESLFGANPDLKLYPYDPEQAKKLLAEAGYPNGFTLTLNAPSDRYVNGSQVAQAVAQMLAKIGIDITLETFPKSVYFKKASAFEYSVYLAGSGADTGEGLYQTIHIAGTRDKTKGWGGANRARYSSSVTDGYLRKGQVTLDEKKREALVRDALKQVYDDYGLIALYHEMGVWAHKANIYFEPSANQRNIYYRARSK